MLRMIQIKGDMNVVENIYTYEEQHNTEMDTNV